MQTIVRGNEPVAVGEVLGLLSPGPARPCVVCGKLTCDVWYGEPCCPPYGDNGEIVSRCKGALGRLRERGER